MSDDRLIRIEDKIDKITEHVGNIDVTMAKNTVILDEHIKRTAQIEDALIPIKAHVDKVKGAVALISLLAGMAAIFEIIKLFVK